MPPVNQYRCRNCDKPCKTVGGLKRHLGDYPECQDLYNRTYRRLYHPDRLANNAEPPSSPSVLHSPAAETPEPQNRRQPTVEDVEDEGDHTYANPPLASHPHQPDPQPL